MSSSRRSAATPRDSSAQATDLEGGLAPDLDAERSTARSAEGRGGSRANGSVGRWRGWWTEVRIAALSGAFLWLCVGSVEHSGLGPSLSFAVCGALHGIAVHGLMRLFPVRRWALPLTGLLCGPVPLVVVLSFGSAAAERGGVCVLAALIGLWIGALEAARRPESDS